MPPTPPPTPPAPAPPPDWQPDMKCMNYASRQPDGPARCDGWGSDAPRDCLELCANSSLPDGCARPVGYRCEYAVWQASPDFPPGRCQVADSSCDPTPDPGTPAAGLDEGLPSLNVSNLLYMENPYSYKKFQ